MRSCKRNVIQSVARNLECIKLVFSRIVVLLTFVPFFSSCEHRELIDPNTGHYLRIYLDEEIKNVTYGFYDESLERPEYTTPNTLRVVLADTETGDIITERYFQTRKRDERGNYFDGYINAKAGEYNLLIYSFGSVVTHVRNERNYFNMQAYTSPIGENYLKHLPVSREELDERSIVQEPEHLFHDFSEPIIVPNSIQQDTLRNADGDYFTAHSVVRSYYIQVKIHGIEWVKTAVSLMSGMAGSTFLHGHEMFGESNSVNLFFTMEYTGKQRGKDERGSTAVMYATFNTFGKLPDVETIYSLNFEFVKTDGSSQVEKLDITPMFDTPLVKEKQWILLEHEIVITPPDGAEEGGGMSPGVDAWGDIKTEIQL